MNKNKKLCLGTVKLGIPEYGFSSKNIDENFDKLNFLKQVGSLGINKFDTSSRYGESECVLGKYINQTTNNLFISSKIDGLIANQKDTYKKMLKGVKSSLENLNLKKLDVCYLHQNQIRIISDPYVHDGIRHLKEDGLISKIGVSVYHLDECEYAVESGIFDYIQVPLNIFDISFYNHFIKNNIYPVRFVARSLLLQGILVNREHIIKRISSGKDILSYLLKLDIIAKKNNISTLEMALRFVYTLENIDHYIIGTTSIHNLKLNKQYFEKKLPKDFFELIYEFASKPKKWSNPRTW